MQKKWLSVFGVVLIGLTLSQLAALALFQKKSQIKIGTVPILQENTGKGMGTIIPFEYDQGLFQPKLTGRKGALITVGSLLRLLDLSKSDFSRVIVLNDDEELTQLNGILIRLIDEVGQSGKSDEEQRAQFISGLLLKRFLSEIELEELSKHSPQSRDWMAALMSFATDLSTALEKKSSDTVREVSQFLDKRDLSPQLSGAFLELSEKETRLSSFFWANTEGWADLVKRVRAKQVQCLTGSIAGKDTLRSIGFGLRSIKESVSMVDLSNLPQSFFMGEAKVDDPELRSRVISNIEALPIDSHGVFFFSLPYASLDEVVPTVAAGAEPIKRCYFVFDKTWFVRGAQAGPSETTGFRRFLKEALARRKISDEPLVVLSQYEI